MSETTTGFIYRFEKFGRVSRLLWRSLDFDGLASIQRALEKEGVEFDEQDGEQAGVRLTNVAPPPITSEQMRDARELLGWSRDRLAALSETTEKLIQSYETEGKVMKPRTRDPSLDALSAIRDALEVAGVTFTNGDVHSVLLKRQPE